MTDLERQFWTELGKLPARAYPVPVATNADFLVVEGRGILAGYAFLEQVAQVTVWQILDGTDTKGEIMAEIRQGASGGAAFSFSTLPRFYRGLFIHFVSGTGTIRGAVYAIPAG